MQSDVSFHEDSFGAIHFDESAKIEELIEIFHQFWRKMSQKLGFDPPMTSQLSNFGENRFFVIYESSKNFWGTGRQTSEMKKFQTPQDPYDIIMTS